MKHLKNYNEAVNPRISRSRKTYPFQIHVEYEHGDADLTTKETFNFTTEDEFVNTAKFFYECMNFVPKTAYGKLGYFYPIPAESSNGKSTSKQVWKKVTDIGKKYGIHEDTVYEYIRSDAHYHDGYADIEGIKATVNGEEKVFVFKKALETNKISLPNIGDVIKVHPDHIPGLGKEIFGGKHSDYMPNSGIKDYLFKEFDANVLDCGIQFYHDYENKYYTSYTHFSYILLLESPINVLKDTNPQVGQNNHLKGKDKPRKLVYQIYGWDPDFETKFGKEKYDGLNYYEID